jgi:general secretion pathway protein L
LAAFAASLFVLLVVSGMVRNSVLARREQAIDQQLCATTEKIIGRCEKDYDLALNMLQGKESPASVVPKVSAVTLLAELTSRMPQEQGIRLDSINIELDRISLHIRADSPKAIDTITQALKQGRCFKEIQERKVEKTRDGGVTFGMEIEVACPGEETKS